MNPDKIYTGRSTIRMYRADCADLMKTGKKWDLAIVDPEYGIDMGARKGRHSKGQDPNYFNAPKYKTGSWDKEPAGYYYFEQIKKVTKNQIVWGANHFVHHLPISRGWVFWDKMPIVPNYSDGELAWTSFDMVLKRVVVHWNGKIRTGIEPGYKCIHPTQKPIKLYKWLITNYAKPGDTILDTHGGSMSIAIACWDLGFDLDICELDKEYFDAAVKRFENHIAQQTLF